MSFIKGLFLALQGTQAIYSPPPLQTLGSGDNPASSLFKMPSWVYADKCWVSNIKQKAHTKGH
jgi:hypothetical protein